LLPLFAVCLAVVFAALAWTSAAALRLEAAAARAAEQAAQEEDVRLALWRIDSALGALLAQENARPPFTYRAFYAAERPYAPPDAAAAFESLVPSPLLAPRAPHALLYFQIDPQGAIVSPQAPRDTERELALAAVDAACLDEAASRLSEVLPALDRGELLAALPAGEGPPGIELPPPAFDLLPPDGEQELRGGRSASRQSPAAQQALNSTEFRVRAQTSQNNFLGNTAAYLSAADDVRIGPFLPLWRGDKLLLARRVAIHDAEWVQGCWLDWPALQTTLAASVKDLLPAARLEPAPGANAGSAGAAGAARLLTALPARLVVDAPPPSAGGGWTPLGISLGLAWACALLAAMAVAALLWGVVSLSERRAAFVSAVTHELRTPLTTLRMYAEMLAGGMVPGEEQRTHYLGTLRGEADRLGHLVENVLAYARLERAPRTKFPPLPLAELLARSEERLRTRAEQCEFRWQVSVAEDAAEAPVAVDPGAVEQILFNLVDNACKHGGGEAGAAIVLSAERRGRNVLLRVRDNGRGVAAGEARRLFRPFARSAREAAESVPGVGLGLALSRRLARQLGGDLRLENPGKPGASFLLTLPTATTTP
jgi:signal transduction histidine kinase